MIYLAICFLQLVCSKNFLVETKDANDWGLNYRGRGAEKHLVDNSEEKKTSVPNEKKNDEYLEEDYSEYDEELKPQKKKKKNKKQSSKRNFRSGTMKGERLSESQIIEYLKQDKIPTFQVRNKEELEKCSPFYYCSNKFMDQVCQPDTMFDPPCRTELDANGGDRGNQGPGNVIGTCTIHYSGCDLSTITHATIKPNTDQNKNLTENLGSDDNKKDDTENLDDIKHYGTINPANADYQIQNGKPQSN